MSAEAHRSFACFGGTAAIHVRGSSAATGERLADSARRRLLEAHRSLSRFAEDSELSRLNRDPRPAVPASGLMRRLATAVGTAGSHSGGLADATLLGNLERAGYRHSLDDQEPVPLAESLAGHPQREPARPHPAQRWRLVRADDVAGTVVRPPSVRIDGGGIAKGLLADLLATTLREHPAFAVDCCGDVAIGGMAGLERRVRVEDPFGGGPVHELSISAGAVATSGVGRRCWIDANGQPAHHLLDPRSGRPAFTGIVQATALAPTALLAETHAKAALLSGPDRAAEWLPHGGVLVHDDGEAEIVAAHQPLPRSLAVG